MAPSSSLRLCGRIQGLESRAEPVNTRYLHSIHVIKKSAFVVDDAEGTATVFEELDSIAAASQAVAGEPIAKRHDTYGHLSTNKGAGMRLCIMPSLRALSTWDHVATGAEWNASHREKLYIHPALEAESTGATLSALTNLYVATFLPDHDVCL